MYLRKNLWIIWECSLSFSVVDEMFMEVPLFQETPAHRKIPDCASGCLPTCSGRWKWLIMSEVQKLFGFRKIIWIYGPFLEVYLAYSFGLFIAQKMNFSVKDFISRFEQTNLQFSTDLQGNPKWENIFCAVFITKMKLTLLSCFWFPILLCRTAVLKIFLFFSKVASIKPAALVTLLKNESIQVFFENLRKFFRTPLGNYCR